MRCQVGPQRPLLSQTLFTRKQTNFSYPPYTTTSTLEPCLHCAPTWPCGPGLESWDPEKWPEWRPSFPCGRFYALHPWSVAHISQVGRKVLKCWSVNWLNTDSRVLDPLNQNIWGWGPGISIFLKFSVLSLNVNSQDLAGDEIPSRVDKQGESCQKEQRPKPQRQGHGLEQGWPAGETRFRA